MELGGASAIEKMQIETHPAEDTDTDGELQWECENDCGFRGTFSTVDTHEAMCSHQRTPHPQPKLNPKMSALITKAVNAAFGALIAQLDKLCHRRDNRVKCVTALIALLADHVHDLKDPEQIAAARHEQKKSAKQTFEVRLKKKRKLALIQERRSHLENWQGPLLYVAKSSIGPGASIVGVLLPTLLHLGTLYANNGLAGRQG
jgi:hypothetical protein